jgi:dihydroorotase
MDIILKNGTVIDPSSKLNAKKDVRISGDKVIEIADKLKNYDKADVIDCDGLIITPGLIDIHVHFREPGREDKEDLASGSQCAAAGGFTSVVTMPNTSPSVDNPSLVKYQIDRGSEIGIVDIYPTGAVTKGQKGEELANMAMMADAGAVAFTDDGKPIMNSLVMRRALDYSKFTGKVIMDHCEDNCLSCGNPVNEGEMSVRLGIPAQPKATETIHVARDIELAELTGGHIHIAHMSSGRSVDMVREAKARGIKITAETCPHYFSITDKAVEEQMTNAKMAPPLKTSEDIKKIKEGLADGTIDAITTDHAPHTRHEKSFDIEQAPFGIIGLETSLGLGLTNLVATKVISIETLISKMSWEPAKILGLDKLGRGKLEKGGVANITVIDPKKKWKYDVNKSLSKSRNSPFHGTELTGKAVYTIYKGKITYKDAD